MSKESLKKFLRAKSASLSVVLVMATAANASAQVSKEQKQEIKNNIESFIKGEKKEVVIPIDENRRFMYLQGGKGNNECYVIADDKTLGSNGVISYDERSTKEAQKEYKDFQKEAFKNAPENETKIITPQDFIDDYNQNNGHITAGAYSADNKNITEIVYTGTAEEIENAVKNLNTNTDNSLSAQQIAEKYQTKLVNKAPREVAAVAAHENQHLINDKNNTYAPGLNAAEYGKLNCWDECSANMASLILANHNYKNALESGMPQEEALKEFDVCGKRYDFYKDAVANGLNPDSKEAKKLMAQGTVKMWQENHQQNYEQQIAQHINSAKDTNTAGLIIGNEKDYRARVNKMFDSFDDNPKLKELGIKAGKFSEYIQDTEIQLSEKSMQTANEVTKANTGFSLEEGKQISDALPGSQKKGQKTVAKILSDPNKLLSLSGRIDNAAKTQAQSESADLTKTQQANNFTGGLFKRQQNNR